MIISQGRAPILAAKGIILVSMERQRTELVWAQCYVDVATNAIFVNVQSS